MPSVSYRVFAVHSPPKAGLRLPSRCPLFLPMSRNPESQGTTEWDGLLRNAQAVLKSYMPLKLHLWVRCQGTGDQHPGARFVRFAYGSVRSLRFAYGYFTLILRLFYAYFTLILRLFYGCFTVALRLLYGYFTLILRWLYGLSYGFYRTGVVFATGLEVRITPLWRWLKQQPPSQAFSATKPNSTL